MGCLTIEDLFRQPWFQAAKCLSGKTGLDRVITWFYLADGAGAPEGVETGDLILAPWPSVGVKAALEQGNAHGAAGLLLLAGKNAPAVPDNLLRRAQEMGFPVLLLPCSGAALGAFIHELTLCIARSTSEQDRLRDVMIALITGKTADPIEIYQKALQSGYNFEVSHQALCLRFHADPDGVETGMHGALERECRDCLGRYYPAYPSIFTNGKMLALLPENPSAPPVRETGEALLSTLRSRFPQVTFYIGVGKQYRKLESFPDSIYESELTARALRSLGRENQAGGVWELMPFALLLAIRDRKRLYTLQDPVLDQLIFSDAEMDLHLIQTLETYLDCGQNGKLAAEKLFIHRNTLKMRLNRIEALTGRSLSDPNHCFQLRFALYVRHFMLHG